MGIRLSPSRRASDSSSIGAWHQTHQKGELYTHLAFTLFRAVRAARLSTK